jgi:(p)ppGpp synthase/HD superfamily hydrolase
MTVMDVFSKKPTEMRGYERYLIRFRGYITVPWQLDNWQLEKMMLSYRLGKWGHRGEYRGDGVTYYLKHLRDVADLISVELGIKDDWKMNVVCWLHDMLESNKITLDTVERLFGVTMRYWVDLLSKGDDYIIDKFSYIRRMKEAGSIEVIIVKLADRVANLRTLGMKPDPTFQIKQIRETNAEYLELADYLIGLMAKSSHWNTPARRHIGIHLKRALEVQVESFEIEYGHLVIPEA